MSIYCITCTFFADVYICKRGMESKLTGNMRSGLETLVVVSGSFGYDSWEIDDKCFCVRKCDSSRCIFTENLDIYEDVGKLCFVIYFHSEYFKTVF